jgi:uncharacterized protein YpuA (DUF1002 family)
MDGVFNGAENVSLVKVAEDAKKITQEELEAKIGEIEQRFQQQMGQQLDEVKEQLRIISQSTSKIEEIESRFQVQVNHELEEIRKQLAVIAESKLKIEGDISDKWNLVVRLRSHSYDQLMSEYTKVEEKLLLERRETEKTDVSEQPEE